MSTREKSELERGFESLGKALTGVTGRLLGPKAIGRETLPPEPAISPEADEAVSKAAEDLGRLLNAAGEALKAHPLEPAEALKTARAKTEEPVVAEEGWSPLAAGLVNLGGGLAKVAEGVLDAVAPRKTKTADGADPIDTQGDAPAVPEAVPEPLAEAGPTDTVPDAMDTQGDDPETAEEIAPKGGSGAS
ncbi:MAG: hypothetical protein ACK4YP_13610 [Myxococcota bacterium]